MTPPNPKPDDDSSRLASVDMFVRLASRHLNDEQLIELLARLEHELVSRAAPIEDQVLSERPINT